MACRRSRRRTARRSTPCAGSSTSSPGWSANTGPPTSSAAGTTTGARSGGSTCCRRTRRTAWWPRSPARPDIEEVPDPLEVQIPIILEVLEAFGICVVGADGYEADDVIGTLASQARQPVDIVTGDRDLFQLVDDEADVRVLYIARGVGKHERVTNDWVRAKYDIDARQYADFATMRGDASDGLPGVPGVGEKTAATLLQRFGDMDGHRRRGERSRRRHGSRPARQDQGGRRLPRRRAPGGGRRPRHRPRLPRHPAARPSRSTCGGSRRSARSGASSQPGAAPDRGAVVAVTRTVAA